MPTFTYQNNIPQASDRLKDSQSDILENFQAIKELIDINHNTFNTADFGKHKFVTFPQQGSDPSTAAGEVALFSAISPYSGVPELSVRLQSNGPSIEFTSADGSTNGWARLPSGILLKWGQSSANGLATITFPAGATIPAFTNIFQMLVTTKYNNSSDGDGFVRLNAFSAPWTQFTVYGSARTTVTNKLVSFSFLAIGV